VDHRGVTLLDLLCRWVIPGVSEEHCFHLLGLLKNLSSGNVFILKIYCDLLIGMNLGGLKLSMFV
jgi:hypothetical protein